jgi:FkbM family methyltransferase
MQRLKFAARALARYKGVGPVLAVVLRAIGAVHLSRRIVWINRLPCPDIASTRLPSDLFAEQSLSMSTADGRDQIALSLWAKGWKAFERPLPEFFSASISDGDVVFDIGANTGLYSLLAGSVGRHVEVYAFEPFPMVADLLAENLRHFSHPDRIHIIREAIDEECGQSTLYIPVDDHGYIEASASLASDFRTRHSSVFEVRKTTIDDFVRLRDIQKIEVIKIDIEGIEERALAGGRRVLQEFRPIVFLEILDAAKYDEIDKIRQAAGYVSVQLSKEGPVCMPRVTPNALARNQVLWPAERIMRLHEVSARLGYRYSSQDLETQKSAH